MLSIQLWKLSGPLYQHLEQIQLDPKIVTIDTLANSLSTGVYTTFRTYYQYKTYPIHVHIERLENSANLKGNKLRLDADSIQKALHRIVYQYSAHEKRIRINVDLGDPSFDVYISIEELTTPSIEEYSTGAHAITKPFERNNPQAKSTSFLADALAIKKSIPSGVNEVLLIDRNGDIREGLSSNFFMIKDGKIVTSGDDVLQGITRTIIMDEANAIKIPIELKNPSYTDLSSCDEAFVSSASRSLLPLRKIDDIIIGKNVPGELTRQLTKRFWERIERETVFF